MRRVYRGSICAVFLFGIFGEAAAQSDWTEEWERTIEAGKKEGQLTIYGSEGFNFLLREFHKRYPQIKFTFVGGSGSQLGQRVMSERRAGRYLPDAFLMGGGTPYRLLLPGKALAPIRPALILPEVLDQSKWWQARHHYVDREEKYIFVFQGDVRAADAGYNKNLLNPEEIGSYWDLVRSKWKGKIVTTDPKVTSITSTGLRLFYYQNQLGPEFLRRLYGEMEINLSRDHRQMLDWLAVGKFAIALFAGGIETAGKQGLPVDELEPTRFKEGAVVAPNRGTVTLINKGPHPNAAKVFINWLLSREGQVGFQKVFALEGNSSQTNSMREDIPKEHIPLAYRRVPGARYLQTYRPEYIDTVPALEVVEKALAGSRKK